MRVKRPLFQDNRGASRGAEYLGGKAFAEHPLVQLTIVRFLETLREPEALFWIFAFPILLAAGLGIAFRNRPAEVLKIATTNPVLAQSLQREKLLAVELLDSSAAEVALRTGKIALLAVPNANGSIVYSYDDTNPEGRTARMLTDHAVQQDRVPRLIPFGTSDAIMREAGSRYIDFLVPGLLGMNLMGSAIWGMGFTVVDARRKKLLKRLVATPMPKQYFLLSYVLSRILMLYRRSRNLFLLVVDFSTVWCAARSLIGCCMPSGFADLQRARLATRFPRQNDRGRFRLDERRYAPHVDRVRRFLFRAAFSRCRAADH